MKYTLGSNQFKGFWHIIGIKRMLWQIIKTNVSDILSDFELANKLDSYFSTYIDGKRDCQVCNANSPTHADMERHPVTTHGTRQDPVCKKCGVTIPRLDLYDRHINRKTDFSKERSTEESTKPSLNNEIFI